MGQAKTFKLFLIKPSHYDDDGYVIQWWRSGIPSNSLAVMNGLSLDCAERRVLGDGVEFDITLMDETNTRIRPQKIARAIAAARQAGGGGMVGMVGVQSNQFPRTMDIVRELRAADAPVCIGGFHVSGSVSMFDDLSPDLKDAQLLGVSLYAGEAEGGRLDEVFQDAMADQLKPLYNHIRNLEELPSIEDAPFPILPADVTKRVAGMNSTFDAGRGCPFQCSFCTIINVQGRKSRFRSADDVEKIVRANLARGVSRLLITDDNFARNKNWEAIFDRLIELRESEGLKVKLVLQVDAMCHKTKNFIEKSARAGVKRVFIGVENINPDNLVEANKRQNNITEYRRMLLAWKKARVITYVGYILGFPADTPESIARDVEIIKRELPVDILEFFYLTPLPGSVDHRTMLQKQVSMDEDLNTYDLNHVCQNHATMSKETWQQVYRSAWDQYYTDEHIDTVLKRGFANRISLDALLFMLIWFYGGLVNEGVHPLEAGFLRRKYRADRRPGMPREWPGIFHLKWLGHIARVHVRLGQLVVRWGRMHLRIKHDPTARAYTDLALTPPSDNELEELDMFSQTQGGKAAVARATKAKARGAAGAE